MAKIDPTGLDFNRFFSSDGECRTQVDPPFLEPLIDSLQ